MENTTEVASGVLARYAEAARSVMSSVAWFHEVAGSWVEAPSTTWFLKRV